MDKLVEENYFFWEYNMRMKLARKGLLPHIVKTEFDQMSDRSSDLWKMNDLKALRVISGEFSATFEVHTQDALNAATVWQILKAHFNRSSLKNRFLITKELHAFNMEPGTRFAEHAEKFKELVVKMGTIGERLDETRQIVLLLGRLTEDYRPTQTSLRTRRT